jgi:hypothetical protein
MGGSVLNPTQLSQLLTLLSEDVVGKNSLDVLCHRLHLNFPSTEAFKVSSAIVHLLQQPGNINARKNQEALNKP